METIFFGFIVILFLLSIFDLSIGVSNDAVNFLNSAIGCKAAKLKTIILIASIGIFCGASFSNGMMEIARHGIFRPEQFFFYDLMCIFLAVVVTDIVLLDIFNSLGMPTSTTVSMVFELLGGTFALTLVKLSENSTGLGFDDFLNTEKALSVIIGIFLSVAIAFFFGIVVQYISRIIFSFNYTRNLKWKIGLFGGIAATAIVYFMLIKGLKDNTFMTNEVKDLIFAHTLEIVLGCLVFFTILMQVLNSLKVNVFKVVVLMGTFSLAMAFAGNDLVNFIGVPLAAFSAYNDFAANGGGETYTYTMESLNQPAHTPIVFLVSAGAIMVIALITSRKAKAVIETSLRLSRQGDGDEMFGSSSMSRTLVRMATSMSGSLTQILPIGARRWIDTRFRSNEIILENGASFDLIRGSVNLVLAGLLIALGTSMKLPLSTTYVTFMVAMGTSLSDRAWGRDSAVFRITGVISVIGGWFITAGAAFIISSLIAAFMYFGGIAAMLICVILSITMVLRSHLKYNKKAKQEKSEEDFSTKILEAGAPEAWTLLHGYFHKMQANAIDNCIALYEDITNAFIQEDSKTLSHCDKQSSNVRDGQKMARKTTILGMRRIENHVAIEKNTWMHLGYDSTIQLVDCIRHICIPCHEHVSNSFSPMPECYVKEFVPLRNELLAIMQSVHTSIELDNYAALPELLKFISNLKVRLSDTRKIQMERINKNQHSLKIEMVYLNLLQESQEMLSATKHIFRANKNF